jgi:putative aldouronate transport system permease protein
MTVPAATSPSKKRAGLPDKYKLFFMVLPFILLVLVFSYGPLFGWSYAFFDYRPGIPLNRESFVGLKWFTTLVSSPVQRGEVLRVMTNTIVMSLLNIACSVLPAAFAVFLSEVKTPWYKKSVQILTTLPNFISWVLVYSFAYALFNTNNGFLNSLLIKLGINDRPINFLADPANTWLKMCVWHIWKTLGWSSIMYLAAIAGIDQELYEAARIDGAGRFQIMWHITVPGIMETYFVLLLLSIANFISNGMEQYFVFQNPMNRNRIEVLDLYVYNIGLGGGSFSYATAVSILKSIVSLTLLFVANGLSKAIRGNTIL